MTPDDVRRATDRFAAALDDTDAALPVPGCPGWSVRDLVAHLGHVHAWAAQIVRTGRAAEEPEDEPHAPLRAWYQERADGLVETLAGADPAAPCWNFARVQETAGFWTRRQVHETQMHLVDLDQAAGRATAIDPSDAADGVRETFEVFGPRLHARGSTVDLDAPVSLRATDTGDAWTLIPVPDAPLRLNDGADATDRLEGRAEDLWLLLWRRRDAGVVRLGDRDRLDRLLASRLSA